MGEEEEVGLSELVEEGEESGLREVGVGEGRCKCGPVVLGREGEGAAEL